MAEQTVGERIAAYYFDDWPSDVARARSRHLAAAIDKAIAEAREEGKGAVRETIAIAELMKKERNSCMDQLAAKEAEAAALNAVLKQIKHHVDHWDGRGVSLAAIITLLRGTAGADLLARLRAAEADVAEWKSKAAGAEHAVADMVGNYIDDYPGQGES